MSLISESRRIGRRNACGFTFLSALPFCVVLPWLSLAAEPHQHGVSELLVALDGSTLTLELKAPGKDIAGFEHEPESAADRNHYAKVLATLKSAAKMFALSTEAACRLEDVDVLDQLSDEDDHQNESHKDEDHKDEDHKDAGHDDEDHGEFRVRYRYRCGQPEKLATIEVLAFSEFGNMKSVKLRYVGPKGQTARELTRREPGANL